MKYKSMFFGSVSGDAYGLPYESPRRVKGDLVETSTGFHEWEHIGGGRWYRHQEHMESGRYSDDSELSIALLKSLIYREHWYEHFCFNELPIWLNYKSEAGQSEINGATQLSKGYLPWEANYSEPYFDCDGDGAIMRVLPIALTSNTLEEVIEKTLINAITTHGHPRALLGAVAYTVTAYTLLHTDADYPIGKLIEAIDSIPVFEELVTTNPHLLGFIEKAEVREGYSEVWEETLDMLKFESIRILTNHTTDYQPTLAQKLMEEYGVFGENRWVGTTNFLSALVGYALLNPDTCFSDAISFGFSDTDTLCNLIGGLMGSIKDFTCNTFLLNYATIDKLLDAVQSDIKFPYIVATRQQKDLKKNLFKIGREKQFVPGFGSLKLVNTVELETSPNMNLQVLRYEILSEIGLTFYIKKYIK